MKIVFLCAVLIVSGITAFAQKPDISLLQGMGDVKYHKLHDEELDHTYHVFVRVPKDAKGKLPTVYLLDGGHTFPMLSSYYGYLRFAEELPDAIIVGISYGNDDWREGNQRGRDFTAPAQDREHYGGASKFSAFFREDLMPLIESKYASDSSKRIVFGQSLGGQYSLFAAQFEPDLFYGHIASNPALHRNLEYFSKGVLKKGEMQKVFVSTADGDDKRFLGPATEWINSRKKTMPSHWIFKSVQFEGHNHFSPATESFRQGLKWILSGK